MFRITYSCKIQLCVKEPIVGNCVTNKSATPFVIDAAFKRLQLHIGIFGML